MDHKRDSYLIPASVIVAGLLIAFAVVYTSSTNKNAPSAGSSSGNSSPGPEKFSACLDSGKHKKAVEDATAEGKSLGVNGTPATFVNGQMISGAVPFAAFREAIEKAFIETPATADALKIRPDDFILGDPAAAVVLIEYGDFQCPFCGRFFKTTEPQLKEAYIKSGKAALVWRDFAFLGEESSRAAEAARCAGEQGKFWEYHDYLFNHQQGENQGTFSDANLKSFATILNLK